MNDYFGPPTIKGTTREDVSNRTGIIEFKVHFSDATGHFDIWNGTDAKYEDFFGRAYAVYLWEFN